MKNKFKNEIIIQSPPGKDGKCSYKGFPPSDSSKYIPISIHYEKSLFEENGKTKFYLKAGEEIMKCSNIVEMTFESDDESESESCEPIRHIVPASAAASAASSAPASASASAPASASASASASAPASASSSTIASLKRARNELVAATKQNEKLHEKHKKLKKYHDKCEQIVSNFEEDLKTKTIRTLKDSKEIAIDIKYISEQIVILQDIIRNHKSK